MSRRSRTKARLQCLHYERDLELQRIADIVQVGLADEALRFEVGLGGEMRTHVALHRIDHRQSLVGRDVDADERIIQRIEIS